ncbi:outer membrane protein assembly factor BamE [Chitiniphilus shinanonensis]|uniref:Outer membrane protein assembly factor BamE n=1 Tax=Chitiniphilus shinanonensis TaxID=553088 RepID=A0ABQ6BU30_9NEIS|nr:outer membrane protein assembly factor BamE [Chitiniphilus shinanonensis]GLS05203.1 outer membrane protein assembly factor BamE [Chitiniphilus shinanonensis]
MQTIKPILLTLTLVGALSGCGLLNAVPHYKLDIPQGNQVTADKVAGLKEGMSHNQVRFLLGTPLLNDPFHADRWDYVYSDAKGGKLLTRHVFTVFFEGDRLVRWEGETLPAAPDTTLRMTSEPKKEDAAVIGSEINPGSPGTTKDVEVKPIIDKDF